MKNVLSFFDSISEFLGLATSIALVKILSSLQQSTQRNFKELILEAIISVLLGVITGVLINPLVSKWVYVVVALVTYIGGKYNVYLDKILNFIFDLLKIRINRAVTNVISDVTQASHEEENQDVTPDSENNDETTRS